MRQKRQWLEIETAGKEDGAAVRRNLVFDEEVIELFRIGGEVKARRTMRRGLRIHDELPMMAEKFKEFLESGEVAL